MNINFYSIFASFYPKDYDLKKFTHYTNELIYFATGEGVNVINGVEYHYTAPAICYTRAGDVRNHFCTKKTDYICIRFYGELSQVEIASGIYLVNSEEPYQLFRGIEKENKQKNRLFLEISNLKTTEILLLLLRSQPTNVKDAKMYELIHRIDRTLCFTDSIQKMADETSYSYDHFRHKFKALTGTSPTDYIINKRMEHACELFEKGGLSCTEIAGACGFSSSAQFSAIFKDRMGISPLRYNKFFYNSER